MNDKKVVRSALGRGLSALISTPPVSVAPPPSAPPGKTGSDISELELKSLISKGISAQRVGDKILPISPDLSPETIGAPQIKYIKINRLYNNPQQPRQIFTEGELSELADSIKKLGVLQPIVVRSKPNSADAEFEIVAGERRWRAAQRAGLETIPAIVRDLDDRSTLEIAIVENVQRANLNPIEEARAYERLGTEFNLTQNEIAERVGKDRVTIANVMRLLKLAPEVLKFVESGELSAGHAKVILGIKDPAGQLSLAKKAVSGALSVRELEELVARVTVLDAGKAARQGGASENTPRPAKQTELAPVIDRMRNALGTKVLVKHHRSGRGKIVVEYFSEQELERIIDQICR